MFLKWQREDNYANIQMNYLGTTTAFNSYKLQQSTKRRKKKVNMTPASSVFYSIKLFNPVPLLRISTAPLSSWELETMIY